MDAHKSFAKNRNQKSMLYFVAFCSKLRCFGSKLEVHVVAIFWGCSKSSHHSYLGTVVGG